MINSELARELKPYIIDMINEIIGEQAYNAENTGDMTFIHGTGFPTDDNSGARETTFGVDLQLSGDDSTVNQAGYSSILGGAYNTTVSGNAYSAVIGGAYNYIDSYYSAAMGNGALTDNNIQFAIGAYLSTIGDAQGSTMVDSKSSFTVSSSWQEIASWKIRTDTTWAFSVLVAGIRQGAAESWGYEITGVIENDGGTTSLLSSTVTALYEDDVSYNCQAVADDGTDKLVIQVIDTDNSGNVSKWTASLRTAEVSWAA